MASVEFKKHNISGHNEIITAPFTYVGDGSTYGCKVELLADVFASNDGHSSIEGWKKEGEKVYSKGQIIFCHHYCNMDGYRVINRP